MQPYDIAHLAKDMKDWLAARFMAPILYVEGGWEYWIQIDFPCWLDTGVAEPYDFRREYAVDGVRLDWIVNATAGKKIVAVNIKAQSHKYLTSKLLADVNSDIVKLKSIKDKSIARKMIVAVVDQNAEQALLQEGFKKIYDAPDNSFGIMSQDVKA
jgi:hypothetical protein